MIGLIRQDPRWLVQKREDGTNVNQWHWSEKDCSEWTKQRLTELLSNITLLSGPATAKTTGLKSVDGDSYLNVRKAKLIASYELNIKVNWEGTTADGQKGSGVLELPYVADENHDEDPEMKIVLSVEDKASQELKAAILASGKEPIYEAIRTYVKELRDGVPTNINSSSSQPAAAESPTESEAATTASNPTPTNNRSSKKSSSSSKRSITLTERFYARATDIYECFVVPGRVMAFTQSPAVVQPQIGGNFSWFNGSISGSFEEMQPGEKLVMSWRFNSWEEGCMSKVELTFSEPEPGNTVVHLKHTGLPEADKFGHGDVQQQVEQGWQGQIFSRIKAVFGYGV
eukprot:GHUV01000980.1.p1 GENE.GHUV01000980.1~~GHUV01000980.1.p1  ORF type:complete len:343 (+),score=79.37 GHUV01000980.1:185-1213(+)